MITSMYVKLIPHLFLIPLSTDFCFVLMFSSRYIENCNNRYGRFSATG